MDQMIDVTSKRFPDIGTGSEETHGILITKKKVRICQKTWTSPEDNQAWPEEWIYGGVLSACQSLAVLFGHLEMI